MADRLVTSVMWPIDPPHVISYWCPIGTEPLSSTIFEIFAYKYIWVTTLTFLGHVTSSVTWPFDSPGAVSYRCCIVTEYISSRFRDNGPQIYPGHRSHDQSISRFPIGVPLEPSLCLQPFSRYLAPNPVHTHTERHTPQVSLYYLRCNVLHWTDNKKRAKK